MSPALPVVYICFSNNRKCLGMFNLHLDLMQNTHRHRKITRKILPDFLKVNVVCHENAFLDPRSLFSWGEDAVYLANRQRQRKKSTRKHNEESHTSQWVCRIKFTALAMKTGISHYKKQKTNNSRNWEIRRTARGNHVRPLRSFAIKILIGQKPRRR